MPEELDGLEEAAELEHAQGLDDADRLGVLILQKICKNFIIIIMKLLHTTVTVRGRAGLDDADRLGVLRRAHSLNDIILTIINHHKLQRLAIRMGPASCRASGKKQKMFHQNRTPTARPHKPHSHAAPL